MGLSKQRPRRPRRSAPSPGSPARQTPPAAPLCSALKWVLRGTSGTCPHPPSDQLCPGDPNFLPPQLHVVWNYTFKTQAGHVLPLLKAAHGFLWQVQQDVRPPLVTGGPGRAPSCHLQPHLDPGPQAQGVLSPCVLLPSDSTLSGQALCAPRRLCIEGSPLLLVWLVPQIHAGDLVRGLPGPGQSKAPPTSILGWGWVSLSEEPVSLGCLSPWTPGRVTVHSLASPARRQGSPCGLRCMPPTKELARDSAGCAVAEGGDRHLGQPPGASRGPLYQAIDAHLLAGCSIRTSGASTHNSVLQIRNLRLQKSKGDHTASDRQSRFGRQVCWQPGTEGHPPLHAARWHPKEPWSPLAHLRLCPGGPGEGLHPGMCPLHYGGPSCTGFQ